MTDKQKQEMLANNWVAYIKASLVMANTSKDKYEIVPYKNWKGIKKVSLITTMGEINARNINCIR
jgi:hypothetical protein